MSNGLERPARAIRLHRFGLSGHCHRVQLLLSVLGLPYDIVEVDLARGAQRSSGFLALNPLGLVPVIEDGDAVIADSNAILVYLAARYGGERWWPRSPRACAEIQGWLSLAAGPLANGPAALRAQALFGSPVDPEGARAQASQILGHIDATLARRPFLAGEEPSLADIAHYAYVARAPEGGLSLDGHRHVRPWLERIEGLPGFVPMPAAGRGAA